MARYGMLINIDKCNGCYNCFLACRDEFEGNDYPPCSAAQPVEGKSWMKVIEKERGSTPKVKVDYIAIPCLQCGDAPCVNKSVDGAVYRRPDGIVIIDPEKAKGNKGILADCPHRLIYWNEEKNLPQKCTFCAHLLDKGWKEPRCVEACPDGAIVFGDLDDPNSEISKLMASSRTEELNPTFALKPHVKYVDLPKRFIAGEVVLADKAGECAPGVTVQLKDGTTALECQTDSFGDFEFDGLKTSQEYVIRVDHKGYKPVEKPVVTYADLNVGVVELEPLG
jgi:Fe-S-cluster-containing dehydrogenase component